jgi:major membrane immunogen (membrane-anchored lipoprotein)
MKKYVELTKLIEMAQVGEVDGLILQIYTDHEEPYFHAIKKDKFDVRILIKTGKILSYKFQKKGAEISSKELSDIQKWMNSINKKTGTKNKIRLEDFWDSMNK